MTSYRPTEVTDKAEPMLSSNQINNWSAPIQCRAVLSVQATAISARNRPGLIHLYPRDGTEGY